MPKNPLSIELAPVAVPDAGAAFAGAASVAEADGAKDGATDECLDERRDAPDASPDAPDDDDALREVVFEDATLGLSLTLARTRGRRASTTSKGDEGPRRRRGRERSSHGATGRGAATRSARLSICKI